MAFKGALLKPSEKGERRPATSRSIAKGSRYEVLKEKIRGWWDDRLKIGEALREIQEGKLYQAEYATFEDFCEEEYGLKRAQAYALISANNVKTSIQMSAMADKITNIKQTRALASVPEDQRIAVIEKVVERGPVTAKTITETAKSIATLKPEKHLDKTGYAIPDEIWDEWKRADDFRLILNDLQKVKLIVEKALTEGDIIFREINDGAVADLKNAWSFLKQVLPYSVCTTCQGRTFKKCTVCKGRGFISEFAYRHWIPEETRSLRERAVKR